MTVGVAVGNDAGAEPLNDVVNLAELKSSSLDIKLPAAAGGALLKSTLSPQTIEGAVYQSLLVGVVGKGRPIKPVSATWPDENGREPKRAGRCNRLSIFPSERRASRHHDAQASLTAGID